MSFLTYPLNNVDYDASDVETYNAPRKSGVYVKSDFQYSITNADTNITIGKGLAWIKNHEFGGKVFRNSADYMIDCGASNPNLPRYDIIAIRFSKSKNTTEIIVKQGEANSVPQYPTRLTDVDTYELYLYAIYRPSGITYVTEENITDLRLSEYCGLMADSITSIDTDAINNQVSSLINGLTSNTEVMLKSVYGSTTNADAVNKAVADKNGDDISSTYLKKSSIVFDELTATLNITIESVPI